MLPSRDATTKNLEFDAQLDNLTEEDFKSTIEFIGPDPLKISTINAQDIFNAFQMFPKVLV